MEIKCTKCGTWNEDQDFCKNCGKPISLKQLQKIAKEEQEDRIVNRRRGKIDLFLLEMKASKNPFVRILYRVLYSLWMVYMAIISFILWFVALGPG